MNQRTYIKAVCKRLKCTAAKKREIEKQLESDISMALENGETLEQICQRMGTPKEAAEEFNENLPEEELKKAKRAKICRISAIVLGIVLLLCLSGYWVMPKTTVISESRIFEEHQLETEAAAVISALDAGDYKALQSQYAEEEMKPYLTEEVIEQAKKSVSDGWGKQISLGKAYMVEITQMGKTFATVQMNVHYENADVTYTISFNPDYKLSGLYMK